MKRKDTAQAESVFLNDHDNQIDNQSENQTFSALLRNICSRRTVLKGGLIAAATGFLSDVPAVQDKTSTESEQGVAKPLDPLIGFTSVAVSDGNGLLFSLPRFIQTIVTIGSDPIVHSIGHDLIGQQGAIWPVVRHSDS